MPLNKLAKLNMDWTQFYHHYLFIYYLYRMTSTESTDPTIQQVSSV